MVNIGAIDFVHIGSVLYPRTSRIGPQIVVFGLCIASALYSYPLYNTSVLGHNSGPI